MRRYRWWLAALVALAIALLAVARAWPDAVEATRVERRDVARLIVLTGRVRPPTRPNLGAATTGVVQRVLVRDGEQVREGQLLVQLDDAQPRAAVAEARAALASARGQALAVRTQAGTALAQAERDLERARRLYQAGAVSTREVELAARAAEDSRSIAAAANARA
ncbi:MAG: efflux RND transporter periplasmic adaptor subunit, partial [Gemmatimonadales bacterium]